MGVKAMTAGMHLGRVTLRGGMQIGVWGVACASLGQSSATTLYIISFLDCLELSLLVLGGWGCCLEESEGCYTVLDYVLSETSDEIL